MCNCIEEVNQKLKEMGKNTQLDIPIRISFTGISLVDRIQIKTCKLDDTKREKPIAIMPAFCPFCGKKYKDGK